MDELYNQLEMLSELIPSISEKVKKGNLEDIVELLNYMEAILPLILSEKRENRKRSDNELIEMLKYLIKGYEHLDLVLIDDVLCCGIKDEADYIISRKNIGNDISK